MAELFGIEVEPEVRLWLESLDDRDFGRVDFLVGLLAEHADTLGEPYPATSAAGYGSCDSTCIASRPA